MHKNFIHKNTHLYTDVIALLSFIIVLPLVYYFLPLEWTSPYGMMIAIALQVYIFMIKQDYFLKQYNQVQDAITLVVYNCVGACVGARLLWFAEFYHEVTWMDLYDIRTPAFSLLGALLGILITTFFYLRSENNEMKYLMIDRLSLYAPVLIGIGRIGCFLVGCCYGVPTDLCWGVMYTDENCLAPIGVALHPTQLYSTIMLLGIFYFFYQQYKTKDGNGSIFFKTIIAILSERFIVDFFRDNRTLCIASLSFHQVLSIVGISIGLILWYVRHNVQRKH